MAKFREIIVKSIDVQAGKYTDINDQLQDFLAHEIYLVPKEDGEHDRYVSDKNGVVSKQATGSGITGDFIPLTGTETDKPVTGRLEFQSQQVIVSDWNDQEFGLGLIIDSQKILQNKDGYSSALRPDSVTFTKGGETILVGMNTGIQSNKYFPPANGNSFVQKDYVSLQNVTSTGNTTTTDIYLNGGRLGFYPTLKSYRFGGNPTSTSIGTNTVVFGHEALNSNTTGKDNTAIGYQSLLSNTTGHRNTAIGIYAGELITTGWNNTIIGNSSASNLSSGYDNIVMGRVSGFGITTGKNNLTIGNQVGVSPGTIQNNNIILGSISGGTAGISNKLIIHQGNLNATTGNPNGTYTPMNWDNALIYGDFVARDLRINGSFSINPSYLPDVTGDVNYSKNIVANANGSFGWKTEQSVGNFIPLSGTEIDKPLVGTIKVSTAQAGTLKIIDEDNNSQIGFQSNIALYLEKKSVNEQNLSKINLRDSELSINQKCEGQGHTELAMYGGMSTLQVYEESGDSKLIVFDALTGITNNFLTDASEKVGYNRFWVQNDSGNVGFIEGNFIPLTGTETNKPILGNLQVDTTQSDINIYNGNFSDISGGLKFQQNGLFSLFKKDTNNELLSNITLDGGYTRITTSSTYTQALINVSSTSISLKIDNLPEETSINVNLTQSQGLYSDYDLSSVYSNKSFVQKAYVDKQIQSTRKSLTNPAVLSGEVFYETIGNKAFVHFELPSLPIASDETLHFESVDGITFKLTQRVIEIFGATKLLISSNNGGGIDIYNPGDSNTFSIFDTLVYFIDPPSPV